MRNQHLVAVSPARKAACSALRPALAVALAISLAWPTVAAAAEAPGKKPASRRQQGYGFLPGYVPPDQFDPLRARPYGGGYWYGYPGFYRGRWNGGGFGPCWTRTPIGPMWNCG
jgi:hypothetical protein